MQITDSSFRLQLVVFFLVSASFANIYITQPVLPLLQDEFGVDLVVVSLTVSLVILGMTLSNLPFGVLVDRVSIRPLVLIGSCMVAVGGIICSLTDSISLLVLARLFQGLFIPALTTCLVAWLAKSLPTHRLNVVMGSYVSATVIGGLVGRLLGGWMYWRYAFVAAAVVIISAGVLAFRNLPASDGDETNSYQEVGFIDLLHSRRLMLIYLCSAGSFAIFSSIFNFLPFRLHGEPFNFSTGLTTLLYLVYISGIFMGPISGKISNRLGTGLTLLAGSTIFGISLIMILQPLISTVVVGLVGVCAGFFTIHSAAVGYLNRQLTTSHGRANALYVLFYYLGGWLGITVSGFAYQAGGWSMLIYGCIALLIIPLSTGYIVHGEKEIFLLK